MPKRKKSQDYCRSRFGIFSSMINATSNNCKRRRMMSSADSRCEECVQRIRSKRGFEEASSLHREISGAASRTNNTVLDHVDTCMTCTTSQQTGMDSCGHPWSLITDSKLFNHTFNMSNHASDSGKIDSVAVYEEHQNHENNILERIKNWFMPSLHMKRVITNDRCACTVSTVTGESSMEIQNKDERFEKVNSLVTMTSSLKLSEDDANINNVAVTSTRSTISPGTGHAGTCRPGTFFSGLTSDTTDVKSLEPDTMDMNHVGSPQRTESLASPLASTLVVHVGHLKPIRHTARTGFTPKLFVSNALAGTRHTHSRPRQRLSPSLPMSDEPLDRMDNSSDDEGFCEPVIKRSHKVQSGTSRETDPDEGVNVDEAVLPRQLRHRRLKYTYHSLDASLGCSLSLYWQMLSNQYGLQTKIYSVGKSKLVCPSERYTVSVNGKDCDPTVSGLIHISLTKPTSLDSPDQMVKRTADVNRTEVMDVLPAFSQEQHSSIYAISKLHQDLGNVEGSLGTSLQHAIHCGNSVFVFDCQVSCNTTCGDGTCKWYQYCRDESRFVPCPTIPVLSQNFAGLGTNELPEAARTAIKAVFTKTFGLP